MLAATAAIGLGLVAPGGAAVASQGAPRAHFARVGTHYAVYRRVCSASVKPGHSVCMAIRRVPASKRTPHAHAYTVRASFPVGRSGGYTPDDLAAAYDFDPAAIPATPQIVAIVDAYDDPNILHDLNKFDARYGLPPETAASFVKLNQNGNPAVTQLPQPDKTGWSQEEALDVEIVRGVCNACSIMLLEAKNPSNVNLRAAVVTAARLHATEITNSYGSPEPPRRAVSKRTIKSYAESYNHPGIVVTAATGDEGWFGWDKANAGGVSGEAPNLPSSLAHVVAVGGTKLQLRRNGTRRTESVWNHNGPANSKGSRRGALGATGGGCSKWISAPSWQADVAGYRKTGCGKRRLAADVAADGDPATGYDVYTSWMCGRCKTGWGTIGGTSLSSPLIAAMWALAGGAGGVSYPAASIYSHARRADSLFFDVTDGGNSWCRGLAHKTCATRTGKVTRHASKNPNFLSIGRRNLGTLDCGFKRHTRKTTHVKADHQCNAVKGYDGPTGVGTPNGLFGFLPPSST